MISRQMQIEIKPTQEDFLFSAMNFLIGLIAFMTIPFIFNDKRMLCIFLIIIVFKVFVYGILDLCFKKIISDDGSSLKIYCLGMGFPINRENSYLIMENTITSHSGTKHPTLNIHRNLKGMGNRLFKNRIKLHYANSFNREKLKADAILISETFGIPLVDNFEDA